MQILWQLLLFLLLVVLPTVTAKCQSYSQAQQVFGRHPSYRTAPSRPLMDVMCGVVWCVLCVGIGDIVFHNGKRVFGQPQELHNQLDDMPLAPPRFPAFPLLTTVYIYICLSLLCLCLCLYPCRLCFCFRPFFTLCNRKCQCQTTWTNPHCNPKMHLKIKTEILPVLQAYRKQ